MKLSTEIRVRFGYKIEQKVLREEQIFPCGTLCNSRRRFTSAETRVSGWIREVQRAWGTTAVEVYQDLALASHQVVESTKEWLLWFFQQIEVYCLPFIRFLLATILRSTRLRLSAQAVWNGFGLLELYEHNKRFRTLHTFFLSLSLSQETFPLNLLNPLSDIMHLQTVLPRSCLHVSSVAKEFMRKAKASLERNVTAAKCRWQAKSTVILFLHSNPLQTSPRESRRS